MKINANHGFVVWFEVSLKVKWVGTHLHLVIRRLLIKLDQLIKCLPL
jgi:hypothetical protein